MKKGDIIVTSQENAGTVAYNVSDKQWCVHFPNDICFRGQADVSETAMEIVLTKEELEELAWKYFEKQKKAYEFVNFHIGQNEIEDAFKTGVISGIEIGYRLANQVINKARNDSGSYAKR